MNLRRLTATGIAKFSAFLDLLSNEPDRLLPTELLESVEDSEAVLPVVPIERTNFATRFELAAHLNAILGAASITNEEQDVGLWAWLTLFHFDAICPAGKDGRRKVRERAAYLPEPSNFQRYYRHLLLGAYLIYRANEDNPARAMAFLCKSPSVIDDVVAQLASRQEFITNRAVVELATKLYYSPADKALRRGAGGKGKGSARRLADVLGQFDVTWDLYAMTADEFLQVLPSEFDRFRGGGDPPAMSPI